jgi:NTE family protein
MTRAFVLSGGGNLGAVQVGMLDALRERGIAPDFLVGTSVGALNAAYVAGRGVSADALEELTRVWLGVRRRDVFRVDPVRQVLALTGRRPSLCSSDGLRRLIAETLPYGKLEDAAVPVHVTATNVLTGEEVCLGSGDAVTAVLASAAVPAVFPAVAFGGLVLCDGAVAEYAGISRAVALGADEVWVLPAGYACALTRPAAAALAAALHAVSLLTHQRLLVEVADFADRVDLHVLPPLCPVSVSPIDFSRAVELIGRGYRVTQAWLADGGDRLPDPERFLSLHDHGRRRDAVARGCPPHAVTGIQGQLS